MVISKHLRKKKNPVSKIFLNLFCKELGYCQLVTLFHIFVFVKTNKKCLTKCHNFFLLLRAFTLIKQVFHINNYISSSTLTFLFTIF